MGKPADNEKRKSSDPPEQKLGDTPVPPWEMPTPEEKAQAEPVKRALQDAIREVDSPEKADRVIRELERETAGQAAEEVERTQPPAPSPEAVTQQVKEATEAAPKSEKTKEALDATARTVTTPDKRHREIVSEAAQEVFNPEQQGATPTGVDRQRRDYLRNAVLKRLKPLDALDASLFLKVNHLPHTRFFNAIFYGLTMAFKGGAAWFVAMGIRSLSDRRQARQILLEVALPLAISGALVEYPVKTYFKRRRPFIKIIQAIVIGKKPGTWSFPSGHSAVAFGGAWLLNQTFPKSRSLRYIVAGLVAFSRMYLGDHYPGDVASGSLLGILFAMFFRWLFRLGKSR